MLSPFWGEFFGTMMLIVLGNGVVAGVLLERSKAQNAGWVVITAGWAFAVTLGIFVAKTFGSNDAHLNPAVTLAFAIQTGNFANIAPYWSAQFSGAFLGAVMVWLHYLPHWNETKNTDLKLAVFCTSPAIRHAAGNMISEVFGTFVLIIGVYAIFSRGSGGVSAGIGPFLVGVLVWAIGLSMGGTSGYAINPARDLAPRLAHFLLPIAGKGPSDWRYAWIPVVAPIVGGAIGGYLLKI
ncbi:MAG TPA: MIP/aquaporin family protein, partial [Turneriella sp.]|nr:MIP/aquaporin family protein [Turneriella sp.]